MEIVRVKRKRTQAAEPYVVDDTRTSKKQRFFRFAETVSLDSFASQEQSEALQQRLHALSNQPDPLLPNLGHASAKRGPLNILDVDQTAPKRRKVSRLPSQRPSARGAPAVTEEYDMDQFMPMLKEYLSLRDDEPLSNAAILQNVPAPPVAPAAGTPTGAAASATTDDDFVYDVYYYSNAPIPSNASPLSRLGQLTGLGADELLMNPGEGSDSEDEVMDEADEDSNEENAHGNEYPSSGSDGGGGSDLDGYGYGSEEGERYTEEDFLSGHA